MTKRFAAGEFTVGSNAVGRRSFARGTWRDASSIWLALGLVTACSSTPANESERVKVGQVTAAIVGDSVIDGDEECDDGDSDPLDGCDAAGKIESGYVCITPGGSFGTAGLAPSGFHPRPGGGTLRLGFVANPQDNDWASYNGDFFLPGGPFEAWGLQVGDAATLLNQNPTVQIPGSLGTPACVTSGLLGDRGGAHVTWTGATSTGLSLTRDIQILDSSVAIIMKVSITNTTGADITDVYYGHSVDPDNNRSLPGGTFATTNTIVSQPDGASNTQAIISASQADGSIVAFVMIDARARVGYGGTVRNPKTLWDTEQVQGTSATQDTDIGLGIKVGTIAAGQTVDFVYAYSLTASTDALVKTLEEAACADDDSDGTCNVDDGCPTDAAKIAAGICGCGTADTDTDGDATADCNEDCDTDPLKTVPGICGCGTSDVDDDGDGTADCDDLCLGDDATGDSDGDGLCTDRDHRARVEPTSFTGAQGGCTEGGIVIRVGLDEDASGALSTPEVTSTAYVCNGVTGIDGLQAVVGSTEVEPGATCPTGGVDLTLGIDTNRSGGLNAGDTVSHHVICNGLNSAIAITNIAEGSEVCGNGGRLIRTGVDEDGNGTLDSDEGDAGQAICNGTDSLVQTATLAPTEECPEGGLTVYVGPDANGDGVLQSGERLSTQAVCHGLNALIETTTLAKGQEGCAMGGMLVRAGTDDDGDGVLDDDEGDSRQVLCAGLNGVVKTATLGPTEQCPRGGTTVSVGTDDNGNGVLDGEEADSTQSICHGLNALIETTTLAPSPTQCPRGGALVEAGLDDDADGVLDDDEITATQTLCSGLNSVIATTTLDRDPAVCPAGGIHVAAGVDDNGDGLLAEIEIDASNDICHGDDSLINVTAIGLPSDVCPSGGSRVEVGRDADGDGVLGMTEVTASTNLCNGKSSLTRTATLMPDSAECAFGGTRIDAGLDDNGDGMLADDEVDATQVLCSGTGVAIRTSPLEPGSKECPVGGRLTESGIDANGNRELDDDEVQNSDALCAVAIALFDTETLAEDDKDCPHGGVRVKIGYDDGEPSGEPANGKLEEAEIDVTRNVCLAPTDVLINGGKSAGCSIARSEDPASDWFDLGVFALGAFMLSRRRRSGR